MFSNVVFGIDGYYFEQLLDELREAKGYQADPELTAEDWQEVIEEYKKIVLKQTTKNFPQDPKEQLLLAIHAVFDSWDNERALSHRKLKNRPDDVGTVVNMQRVVFGNRGADSGTGVAFTRNPSAGEAALYGEYLVNAQGEDVVAGVSTLQPIDSLAQDMTDVYERFLDTCYR